MSLSFLSQVRQITEQQYVNVGVCDIMPDEAEAQINCLTVAQNFQCFSL